MLLLFALPLNVLTSTLWRAMIARLRERSCIQPAGGVRILKQSGETRVSLVETSAFEAGFYAMAAAAFFTTGRPAQWPESLDEWLEMCHRAGQRRRHGVPAG